MAEIKKLFLETDVDKLMELVGKKKKITIKEAAAHLGEDEAVVGDWIKILESRGYLKISYPIAGTPFIEMGERKVSESEESEEEPAEFVEESEEESEKKSEPERKQIEKKKKYSKSSKTKKAPKKKLKKPQTKKKKGRR